MPVLLDRSTVGTEIAPHVLRKVVHLEHLMLAVIDITDGPMAAPDPPHAHPHEQTSYVAKGRLRVFIGEQEYALSEGDVFYVPSEVPHTIQTLTEHVRLVDNFTPLRETFLG